MIFVTNDDRMGKNIRYLRQKNGMSQEALARLVGIDCPSLDAIEQGILPDIDAQVLKKISTLFGVDLRTLVENSLQDA